MNDLSFIVGLNLKTILLAVFEKVNSLQLGPWFILSGEAEVELMQAQISDSVTVERDAPIHHFSKRITGAS
jgi:hypothetical protein